jgi:hypothetical protein
MPTENSDQADAHGHDVHPGDVRKAQKGVQVADFDRALASSRVSRCAPAGSFSVLHESRRQGHKPGAAR